MQKIIYDCIVIGAGAAGLFYAACDESVRKGPCLILEKTNTPGQKLLISGNGMCNITHGGSIKDFVNCYGENGGKIRRCLFRHNNIELIDWLTNNGIPVIEREDGKVFPKSMKAGDVLQMLLRKAKQNGFELRCKYEVTGIRILNKSNDGTKFTSSDKNNDDSTDTCVLTDNLIRISTSKEDLYTRKLVIATGGASIPQTGSDGSFFKVLKRDLAIDITSLKPALVPVYVENYIFRSISGISFDDVLLSFGKIKIRGALLFTHKNLSGPAALHMSQYIKAGDIITADFLPDMNYENVFQQLKKDHSGNNLSPANYIAQTFRIPKAFAKIICDKALTDPDLNAEKNTSGNNINREISTDKKNIREKKSVENITKKFSALSNKDMARMTDLLKKHAFSVSGTGGFKEAMVTSGGVCLSELNLSEMTLKKHPNIKVIGEALDVNGDTGGYNLQFAYSSAKAAVE